ncbi:hypothetical protein EB231_35100 [Mesorhizobium sp. NZP2298]|nr:hypothetical protein EB231_35100 [Mesorhizobium sp. NZP2298]
MKRQERARAMRAAGTSFDRIAEQTGLSVGYIRNFCGDVERVVKETAATVVRYGAHNGGCSSLSGMQPISMPRITTLHGVLA